MDQDLDTEPAGGFGSEWPAPSGNNSSTLSPGNKMDIDILDDDDHNSSEDAAGADTMTNNPDGSIDGNTTVLQKLPMPSWVTDPTARIELTSIPSVDNPRMGVEILVHYCTAFHVQFVGLMHVKSRRNHGESNAHQELSYRQRQEPSTITTDIAAPARIDASNTPQQDAPGSPQASTITVNRTPEIVLPVFVVFVHLQPLVEQSASTFVSLMQDCYSYARTDPFGIIQHYTKVFVNPNDAKTYAMNLFRERTTLDYRYIAQKSWHSITPEEQRGLGVTPIDGPWPHFPMFKFSMDDRNHSWQVRFGCDEEYCRIIVMPVHPHDPRVKGLEFQQPTKRADGNGGQHGEQSRQAQSSAPAVAAERI